MRLDKYVMTALQISRNDARKIIKNKMITCNNVIISKNDYFVKDNDEVCYLSQKLEYKEYIYLMMNKPKHYLCANESKNTNQKVVFDLIQDYDVSKLFCVGRLDIDTEGLLLITNDGKLCHDLTSPKKECPKKYYCEVDGEFKADDIKTFADGVEIFETIDTKYKCKKATLEIIDKNKAYITITEGKYHQVKKMCKAVGNEVIYLKRISIGELLLDEALQPGEYRDLNKSEIENLKK